MALKISGTMRALVEGGIDAFDLDGSVGQQTCSVVVPEGDVQLAVRHASSPGRSDTWVERCEAGSGLWRNVRRGKVWRRLINARRANYFRFVRGAHTRAPLSLNLRISWS